MKQTTLKGLWLPAAFALVAVALFSCNKDISVPQKKSADTTNNPPQSESSMVAVVEGDSFIALSATAVISDTAIIITGLDNVGARIQLVVKETDGVEDAVGVYSLVAMEKSYATYRVNASENYRADSAVGGGQIRITSIDTVKKIIAGTFSFQGERVNKTTKAITGGVFKMTYTLDMQPDINDNDTTYSTNPKRSLSTMSAIVVSDTIDFKTAESFMYLGYLHLTGYNNDGEMIVIEISPDAAVGAVELSGNFGPNSAYYRTPEPNQVDYAAEEGLGNLSITTHDKTARHIVGTFSFQGKITGGSTTKQINNGKLDFYY